MYLTTTHRAWFTTCMEITATSILKAHANGNEDLDRAAAIYLKCFAAKRAERMTKAEAHESTMTFLTCTRRFDETVIAMTAKTMLDAQAMLA